MFVTVTHDASWEDRRAGESEELPIVVGNGVWIASRVTVLPGTVIEDGCIIASGAVVRGKCEAHGFYAGMPAKRVKELPRGTFFRSAGRNLPPLPPDSPSNE